MDKRAATVIMSSVSSWQYWEKVELMITFKDLKGPALHYILDSLRNRLQVARC